MDFRVTPNQTTDIARMQLQRHAAELQRTQVQLSTGLRLQKPSDDPIAVRRSLIQQDNLARLESQLSAMQHAESRLSQAHVELREAHQLYVRARGIALSARQSLDASERDVLAAEIQGILDQFVSVANSSDESGFLFSGTATGTRPFTVSDNGSGTQDVLYNGAPAATALYLTNDITRESLASGDRIFQPSSREPSVMHGNTGAAVGPGTDTASGVRELQVAHTLTTYLGTSGVAAGSGSVAGDTVLGAVGTHQLQINDTSGNGTSGTISLNGGEPITFSASDTNLKVTAPSGEVLYLDTTAIAPGFSGSVDLITDGTLSLDGGATTQPITFAADQSVTDSRDGGIVHVDTTGVIRTGINIVELPGTADAFQALQALRDDMRNTRGLTEAELADSLNRRLSDIERIEDHLLDEIGTQSVALEQLSRLTLRTEDLQLNARTDHGNLVAADMAHAALRLQEIQNLQQFTMASVGRLQSQSLLDFLR